MARRARSVARRAPRDPKRRFIVARSNPCFELWLILHERDHDRPDHRHAIQDLLAALRPEYDADRAKTPDCNDLVTRVEEAEQRAETQLQRREQEDALYGNPSTTVGRLTRAIREADELARKSIATTVDRLSK